jgi:hypothetical protein
LKIKDYKRKGLFYPDGPAVFAKRVEVIAGDPAAPEGVTAEYLHDFGILALGR